MKFGFIFLFLLPSYSFAFLGLGDSDLCEKNPNDLLCNDLTKGLIGDTKPKESLKSLVDGELDDRNYSIFSNQGDHLKELVHSGKYESAAKLFEREEQWFWDDPLLGTESNFNKYEPELIKVSKALNSKFEPSFREYIADIEKFTSLVKDNNSNLSAEYKNFKNILNSAQRFLSKYSAYKLLMLRVFESPLRIDLIDASDKFKRVLEDNAKIQITYYNFINGSEFFKNYPVELEWQDLLSEVPVHVENELRKLSIDEIFSTINEFGLNEIENVKSRLTLILLEKAANQTYGNNQPPFLDVMKTLSSLRDKGIPVNIKELPDKFKADFVLVENSKDLDEISSLWGNKKSYMVIIDKRNMQLTKEKPQLEKVSSEFVSSKQMVSNPQYVQAKNAYNNAVNAYNNQLQRYQNAKAEQERQRQQYLREQELRRLNAGSTTNCNIMGNYVDCNTTRNTPMFIPDYSQTLRSIGPNIAASSLPGLKQNVESSRQRLDSLPSQVEEASYSDYEFTTESQKISKKYNYEIYILNKLNKTYQLIQKPMTFDKNFVIAKGLNPQDRSYRSVDFNDISDIQIFEDSKSDHNLGEIMLDLSNSNNSKKIISIQSLATSIRSAYTEVTPSIKGSENISSTSETSDPIKDLERIKNLLDRGVINKDDYETLKEKIIDKL